MNCVDNFGVCNFYIIFVKGIGVCFNRLFVGGVGDMVMVIVKKGKFEFCKKVYFVVIVC